MGDVLNNTYRIEEVLGRGGTSEVYRARSEISGRVVALKALRQEFSRNEDFLALMTREEDMREIRHEAVVRYYDNQRTQDGLVYLVMDYIEGPALDQKLAEGGMSADDLMIVARRVTEGLVAAHGKKIVHRDLSPDNIILRHGNPADAVIIDFGIAKDTNEGAETIVGNEFAGKYAYAAPEQLSGQTDARADIYALGALLLATFRGEKPDAGANPMEVVNNKANPLDTTGVPEPMRGLIDAMTQPDREKRLQTAQAVLDQIDGVGQGLATPPGLDEATVIVPIPEQPAPAPLPKSAQKPASPPPAAKTPAPKANGARNAALAAVVLAAVAGGGFGLGLFDGLLGPRYPSADPFVFSAARAADDAPKVAGNVPSEAVRDDLVALMDELGGSADLTLASGDIHADWGADITQLIGLISVLPEWQLAASGDDVTVSGTTDDATQHAQLMAIFDRDGLPEGLTGTTDIAYVPRFLQADSVRPILERHTDCGPIQLLDPPSAGYGDDAQVSVKGKVADIATRVALSDDLVAAIDGRDLLLDVEVLNPTLCAIDAVLPNAPAGGFETTFRMGADGSENASGRFFVGENPVIDVTVPAGVNSGYLFVSALDVSGKVFHLLPNVFENENGVAALRDGATGPMKIRVAYPLADAGDGSKLAFTVDESALGKTRIIVLHADDQIFGGLRPTEESAGGYIEALANYSGVVRTLDSRILTTAKP